MREEQLLSAVLDYARKGKAVFPCNLDKKPLVKGGFKAASSDESQLRSWWTRWPEAMIGMPTGKINGVIAIDCDGEAGIANFLALCREDGVAPDTTWQSTPNGGRHYLFIMPEDDIHCSASQLAPSVDIRASGGYIICAPSKRKDGKSYEWQSQSELTVMPDPLLKRLLNLGARKGKREQYGQKALSDEVKAVRRANEGERNTRLNQAAFNLGQLIAGGMLDASLVERELLDAAQSCGLAYGEAVKTIESGISAGLQKPRLFDDRNVAHKPVLAAKIQINWPEPVQFASFNLPKLRPEMLPPLLGEYGSALAEEKQTPLELPVCMSLVSLAAAAQSRFMVKIREGYCEPLNLYAICPLEPANRKSAIVAACAEPLLAWEEEQAQKLAPEIKRLKSEKQTIERAIEGKRAKAAKARDREGIQLIQAEITDLEPIIPDVPNIPRLLADNTTPEALAALMEQMGGCIAIMSGEGGIFDILGGMYSQGVPNLDLFLKAHCGEAFRVDRRLAPPVILNRPLISLGISPQPITLSDRSASKVFRRRGLDGRFLYFMPESILGKRKLEPVPMANRVKSSFQAKIFSLLPGEPINGKFVPIAIELANDAYAKWLEFAGLTERELAPGGGFEGMSDWGGKLPGAVARLAGLFHLASHEEGWKASISRATMEQAVNMGFLLAEHAKAAYALMGADERIEGAKRILAWIKRLGKDSFSVRDCQQALKQQTIFNHVQAIKEALAELEERGFIREKPSVQSGTGRKPGPVYEVNPLAIN